MDGPNRGKVGDVKALIKDKGVQVLLNSTELRDLDRAVALERKRRETVRVSRGGLLRELAMPRIRELAETAAAE